VNALGIKGVVKSASPVRPRHRQRGLARNRNSGAPFSDRLDDLLTPASH